MSVAATTPTVVPEQTYDLWGYTESRTSTNAITGVTSLAVQPQKANAFGWSPIPGDRPQVILIDDVTARAMADPVFAGLLQAAADANLALLAYMLIGDGLN